MKIKEDIAAIKERDPSARSMLEVLLLYPGVHTILIHRLAHYLYNRKIILMANLISKMSRFLTGIEIHPSAHIGYGVLIDHGMSIVIGENVTIGDECTIYQGVSLMAGKKKSEGKLILGRNVFVGSGAVVYGSYEIGDNCKIGANAVVLDAVPKDSTVAGVPATVVKCLRKRTQSL